MFEAIDRWIDRLEGLEQPPLTQRETIENAAQLLLSKRGGAPMRVALVSTLRWDEPARLCALFKEAMERLGCSASTEAGEEGNDFVFTPCTGVLTQGSSLSLLKDCDAAILIEKKKKSTLPGAREALALLEEQGAPVIGMILA